MTDSKRPYIYSVRERIKPHSTRCIVVALCVVAPPRFAFFRRLLPPLILLLLDLVVVDALADVAAAVEATEGEEGTLVSMVGGRDSKMPGS